MKFRVNHNPCSSCPYRKDHPSGVWSHAEYEKLRSYDDNSCFSTFLCHQSTVAGENMLCKGWLMTHRDSVAVRLLQVRGNITPEVLEDISDCELHESGNAAADAGQRDIDAVQPAAQRMMDKLLRTGRFKLDMVDETKGDES